MWTILLTTWRQGGCLRLELRTKRFKSWIETRKAEHHHKSSAQEMDGTSSDQEPRQFPAKDTSPTSRRQNLHTEKHILQYIYIYIWVVISYVDICYIYEIYSTYSDILHTYIIYQINSNNISMSRIVPASDLPALAGVSLVAPDAVSARAVTCDLKVMGRWPG